ncbi:hypothetical protein [Arthrobacter sp. MMS18-M83]|uniref:hypothetical protein n=1 Tax=Arthrobacter sp. MMS18-M83 TaxID=2996261 RepID=UPI00227C06E7|nr:hypothetical protein [Arthrobacter sp. MMS18-M83]WAH97634.1 hypothetical protein OW521_01670 [Arthrobacter sp. MMS18-M83]
MKSKIPGALAFGLLGVFSLSACGGAATTASGAELAGAPVKLMSIAPQGTSVQNFPGLLAAAHASVRAINARGGIKGGKVELIYCNEKADAAAGESVPGTPSRKTLLQWSPTWRRSRRTRSMPFSILRTSR